ncbi:MAG: carbohydrate ABC transporter permease [Ruminococcaceae bacterium]|nr:carbohydrate ABC transporter permease [Oscillospiraceae bacterium]
MSEMTATVENVETTEKKTSKFSIKGLIEKYENLGYRAKKKISFVISRIFLYFVLIEMAYLFILPFLYIFSTAFMTSNDYLDPTVEWIPTTIEWSNFSKAFVGLNYINSFIQSAGTSILSAIFQTLSCAIIGYAIGRFKFKGRNLIFFFVVLVLLIPPQTTILSSYGMWSTLGMINTWAPIVLPCIFGLGYRGALFVLIYMYFFQRVPDVLDDAARIDGAGPIRLFIQIMLPLVKSAIAIVCIFSFVWHWNDNYETPTYMFKEDIMTLQPKLEKIRTFYSEYVTAGDSSATIFEKAMSEPMLFAGCLMVMIPVLLVYIFGQKQLTQGIERMGIIE